MSSDEQLRLAVDLHDKIAIAVGNQQAADHAREVNDRNAEHDFARMRDDALQDALKIATTIAAALQEGEGE